MIMELANVPVLGSQGPDELSTTGVYIFCSFRSSLAAVKRPFNA